MLLARLTFGPLALRLLTGQTSDPALVLPWWALGLLGAWSCRGPRAWSSTSPRCGADGGWATCSGPAGRPLWCGRVSRDGGGRPV